MYNPEELYKLEKYKDRLQKYCHGDHCKAPQECPQEHEQCKAKLGLDTAVAWILCGRIRQYLTTMYQNQYSQSETKRAFTFLYNSTIFAIDTIGLHNPKYEALFDILYELHEELSYIDAKNRIIETNLGRIK